jgi:dUTP pyrophosphatase
MRIDRRKILKNRRIFNHNENINKKIGEWLILDLFKKNGRYRYVCECSCGRIYDVDSISIINGKSTKCKKCADKLLNGKNNCVCFVCGKKFHRKQSAIDKNETNFCSIVCSSIFKRESMKGENNHQYGLKGELNSSFKSDIRISEYGYIEVRNLTHPFRNKAGFLLFHRLVYENYLKINDENSPYLIEIDCYNGKYLSPEYIIHHNDHNKLNNLIDNLSVTTLSEHTTYHNKFLNIERNSLGRFEKNNFKKNRKDSLIKYNYDDAGYDIISDVDDIVPASSRKLIKTNLKIELPVDTVGLIYSKSGLSLKHGIEVGAGCIDRGYTGEVGVILYNHSEKDFIVKKNDSIAQLLVFNIKKQIPKVSNIFYESERKEDGYGSTEKK